MESIGRLAGGIAHDFNNLLTVISGNAEMGRASVAPGAPAHDELAQIAAAADRAAALTRQLLSFARRQVVEPRTLDLDGVVAGLEGLVRRLIGGHIELRMSRGTPAPFVRADRVQIEQVVLNLVANARDAMPDGGTLSIATGIIEAGDEPPVAGMPPGRYATLTVSDTGVGMADEVRAHAFEPFFTTKDVGAGTGLGLASCYGIATQHGGFMSVESAHGQGAAFTLYLPLTAAAADETRPAPVAPRPRGHERILLVEDDEAVRRLATRALEASGFSVIAAGDGEEALALFGRSPAIDCVVTDVAMPRLGGAPLVRTIRQGRGRTPVIITSGYVGEAAVDDLLDDDTEFLPKPYAVDELVRRVRTLLDRGASRPPA
jgi:CheY-like chemotaxis protein